MKKLFNKWKTWITGIEDPNMHLVAAGLHVVGVGVVLGIILIPFTKLAWLGVILSSLGAGGLLMPPALQAYYEKSFQRKTMSRKNYLYEVKRKSANTAEELQSKAAWFEAIFQNDEEAIHKTIWKIRRQVQRYRAADSELNKLREKKNENKN